jgi:threonine/homoserine/homoserine lactone efflux protein
MESKVASVGQLIAVEPASMVAMPTWLQHLLPNMALFAVIWLPIAMVPGPATAVVIRQTLRAGRGSAFAATMANQVGLLFWALVATFGIASIVAFSQVAYDAVRIVGAAILIVLGLQSLLGRHHRPDSQQQPESNMRGFRVGFVTALANPKAAAFVFALLPQFVPHGALGVRLAERPAQFAIHQPQRHRPAPSQP